MGHEVTVVASRYSHYRMVQPIGSDTVLEEYIDGIRYLWFWGPNYNAGSKFGRIFSMCVFTIMCFFKLRSESKFDLIVCSSPQPFAIFPAYRLAKRDGAKLIFDIRDLWPLSIVHLGGFSTRNIFVKIVQKAEDFACKNADLVIAVPQNSRSYLESRGLQQDRFIHIPNSKSIYKEKVPVERSICDKLLSFKKNNGFILGYAGMISDTNAIETLLQSISKVPSNIKIVILGDGPSKNNIRSLSLTMGIADRVLFIDPVDRNQVSTVLDYFDVCYAGTKFSELYQYGASLTKIGDYMENSKPIVYAVGDPGNPVELSGCGICCIPESTEEVTRAIKKLYAMSDSDRFSMGEKGRIWSQDNLSISHHARIILEKLDALSGT